MKTTVNVICLALFFVFGGLLSSASAEDGLSVGAMTWYAWWSPSYFTPRFDKKIVFIHAKENIKIDPEFLYGPVASLKIGKLYLSGTFLMGRYKSVTTEFITDPILMPFWNPVYMKNNTIKYDMDSTVGYPVTDYLKLYIGFKYQSYKYKTPFVDIGARGGGGYIPKKTSIGSYSPGLGVNLNVHIAAGLYFISNISIVQTSTIASDYGTSAFVLLPFTPGNNIPMIWPNYNTRRYIGGLGVNLTPSLAYLIEPISTTISAGFRYQYVHNFPNKQHLRDDHFYGVTLAASYFIGFGGGKEN
ncbi:MAG: hypothetical protein MUD12_11265 [Spirochaetes bacterium]|jgi:hypothetical protein|nr:hypothetical protein [Spirochaetota bacterium]